MANYGINEAVADCLLIDKLSEKMSSEYIQNNYPDFSESVLKEEIASDEDGFYMGESTDHSNGQSPSSNISFFNNTEEETAKKLNIPLPANNEIVQGSIDDKLVTNEDFHLRSISQTSANLQLSDNVSLNVIDNSQSAAPNSVTVKSFGPSSEKQRGADRSQNYSKIRRVPSTANPKYKIPNLPKTQRSKSQPIIHNNYANNSRRNSSPSQLASQIIQTPQHAKGLKYNSSSDIPNFVSANQSYQQVQPNHPAHPQQQIIYLQIPQPSPNLLSDPQGLQQQISSQLQLLVPQIYNQLLNQINKASDQANLNTVKVSLTHNDAKNVDSETESSVKNYNDNNYNLTSSFVIDENQSQRVINQVLQQNLANQSSSKSTNLQNKRQKTYHQRTQGSQKSPRVENISEKENLNNQFIQINDFCQILQHIPTHILQQQQGQSKSELSYIEIQQIPGYPNMKIPITQELIAQCQQLQQQTKEAGASAPYQPRLETILEESHSVKHLSISRFPKTKIIACILTVLCVVVVILLAGDKTVAVAVIAAIFILFLLGSTFYLYTHSTKSEISESIGQRENQRLHINTISNCNKPSMV